MDLRGKLTPILIATCVILLSASVVWVATDLDLVRAAAAILVLFANITIWSIWALSEYGIDMGETSDERPHAKAKREHEDARLGLLISLLTPDQRDALTARLADELDADGEAVSLADLLAEQEASNLQTGRVP